MIYLKRKDSNKTVVIVAGLVKMAEYNFSHNY